MDKGHSYFIKKNTPLEEAYINFLNFGNPISGMPFCFDPSASKPATDGISVDDLQCCITPSTFHIISLSPRIDVRLCVSPSVGDDLSESVIMAWSSRSELLPVVLYRA